MRELFEETGTDKYIIKQELPWKISIDFNEDMSKQIGYKRQETTMFLVEFIGKQSDLKPIDKEIDEIMLVESEDLIKTLSHEETAQYVQKYSHMILR
jgi:8-oxo-dGTP pyrophosphatase MutT (NUDIX family)